MSYGHLVLPGKQIKQDLSSSAIAIRLFSTCQDALEALKNELASEAKDILFSPACASFDEFKNFEETWGCF